MEGPRMTFITHLLRRIVPATLLAATATLGGSALGDPATACAAPNTEREWDIGKYDLCVQQGNPGRDEADFVELLRRCCLGSGGDWNGTKCVAPPAAPAQAPPGRLPPGIDIQTATPVPADLGPAAPPPVVITPAP